MATRRALIVEDNREIAALVKLHLRDVQCEADIAGDGRARPGARFRAPLRPRGPRPDAPGDGRARSVPGDPHPSGLRPDPDADREVDRARPGAGSGDGRGRLSRQAVQRARAPGAGKGAVPARRSPHLRGGHCRCRRDARARRAQNRDRQATRQHRRPRGHPHRSRVRPAGALRTPPGTGVQPRTAARPGMGLQPRGIRAHRELAHQPVASEDRARSLRPGVHPHGVGRGLQVLRPSRRRRRFRARREDTARKRS